MNTKTLCLGILSFEEASGYEIKKMVEDGLFSHFIEASYGSIYPALTQMLADGLVTVRAEEQNGKPDKKVYAITDTGRKVLAGTIDVMPRPNKFKSEFLFQILLSENLSSQRLMEIYDTHLDGMRQELARIRACSSAAAAHPGLRFVNGYGDAAIAAGVAYLERERERIAGLVAQTSCKTQAAK